MSEGSMRLVALLGSINVGGNRVKMADLREALSERGFVNVATVTASGNLLFDGNPGKAEAYAAEVRAILCDQFGIDTFAIVKTRIGLYAALEENPFIVTGADNLVHVHFLDGQPAPEAFELLASDHAGRGPERLAAGTCALHIDYVDGVAGSKLTGPFMMKRLGYRGTARNIRSIRRIAEAME